MSELSMTPVEQKNIDLQVEQMMDWAKSSQAEAEQLAMDSARLMACTGDRLDRIKNQGFFKRCWNRFTGKTGEMERANTSDLISMQKMAFRYVNMLQEQQLLMAHSLLALKNNLVSLAVKEAETRNMIGELAQKTLERFESLESRVDQLEISTNLQGWLLGLEERDYDEKFPTDYMRLFRVINDFYQIKKDQWNYNDLMFMRKAIRTVGLNPKQKISLNTFIDRLVDEIQSEKVGFDAYGEAITQFVPKGVENYSKYALENVSSPVFVALHGLKTQYMDRLDMVEELQDEMNISASEALKRLLRRSIKNLNVDMDYEFPLAETAIEILGCLRMADKLATQQLPEKIIPASIEIAEKSEPTESENKEPEIHKVDVNNMILGSWKKCKNLPRGSIRSVVAGNGEFYVFCRESDGFILGDGMQVYRTIDFEKFSHFAEFSASSYSEQLFAYENRQLLYIGRVGNENFLFLVNPDEVIQVEIPSRYMNNMVEYQQILYENGKWYIIGSSSYDSKLILSGNDITELALVNFEYKVIDKYIKFTYFDNKFYIIGESNNTKDLLYSSDMKKWQKSRFSEPYFSCYSTSSLPALQNNLYLQENASIYQIISNSVNEIKYSYLPKSNDQAEVFLDDSYRQYGIIFLESSSSYTSPTFSVSNDLKHWTKIELNGIPNRQGDIAAGLGEMMEEARKPKLRFVYGFGKLIFWGDNEIKWREMK